MNIPEIEKAADIASLRRIAKKYRDEAHLLTSERDAAVAIVTTLRTEVARLERGCAECGGTGYATTSESISAGVYCCSCKAGKFTRELLQENRKYVEERIARKAAEAKCERVLLLKEGCWRSAGELLDGIDAALDATEGK